MNYLKFDAIKKKETIYRLFNEVISEFCVAGEIIELELFVDCTRCYMVGEDTLSLYVYESFAILEELDFLDIITEVTENATEILKYTNKDNYETLYSIYEEPGMLN